MSGAPACGPCEAPACRWGDESLALACYPHALLQVFHTSFADAWDGRRMCRVPKRRCALSPSVFLWLRGAGIALFALALAACFDARCQYGHAGYPTAIGKICGSGRRWLFRVGSLPVAGGHATLSGVPDEADDALSPVRGARRRANSDHDADSGFRQCRSRAADQDRLFAPGR
jgi:hypothetical protein